MNTIPRVKEKILEAAKSIAVQNGVASINIRTVAANSGVAVGTVYNHFPTKGDLIGAVVEDFWQNAFAGMDLDELCTQEPVAALRCLFFQLNDYLLTFKSNWLEQLSMLNAVEKLAGRVRERKLFGVISTLIEKIIANGTTDYTPQQCSRLALVIFENMIGMLKHGETDFALAEQILTKLLT